MDTHHEQLCGEVDKIFSKYPEMVDHRKNYPWLTGALGDPYSRIWFLAENPSLTQLERAHNPGGGAMSPEAQWFASKGDRLFRNGLILAGFKDPPWNASGGWHCYITNVIKGADRAEKWNVKDAYFHRKQALKWLPVLRWQLEISNPKLIVVMGNKVEKLIKYLINSGLLKFPETAKIHHYSYIAFRPEGTKGPMHPDRIENYNSSLMKIRRQFMAIK